MKTPLVSKYMPRRIADFAGLDTPRAVKREADAVAVYDVDAQEFFAFAPGVYWSLAKSKALRERGTGHKCVYVGYPVPVSA